MLVSVPSIKFSDEIFPTVSSDYFIIYLKLPHVYKEVVLNCDKSDCKAEN